MIPTSSPAVLCTSPMPLKLKKTVAQMLAEANAEIAVVKVGSLDDPSAFQVQADIWTSAAQPWHRLHEGAAKFEKTPMPGG